MLIQQTFKFKLTKPILQVHCCSPALDDSIVILGQKALGKDAIYHYDRQSKLKFEHTFQASVFCLHMMTDNEVLIPQVPNNRIFILDLRTHKVYYYRYHYFQIDTSCQVKMQTFYNTSLVCVRQNGAVNDNRLKLTYYRYPFPQDQKRNSNQVVTIFQALDNEWNHDYTIRKGNNHSMILWFKQRQDSNLTIRIFDLYDKDFKNGRVEGNYREICIEKALGSLYNIPKVYCVFCNVWEMKRNVFMLACNTDKAILRLAQRNNNLTNNFVWDVEKKSIRESTAVFDPKWSLYQSKTFSSGRYSLLTTIGFDQKGAVKSPCLFIDNENEKVLAIDMVMNVSYMCKWILPGYDESLFIQGYYDNQDVSQIELKSRKVTMKQMASFHMLVQMEEQIDEDLLAEAVGILDYDDE